MNFYKEFIKNRFALFIVSLSVWITSLLAGVYYVSIADKSGTEAIGEYIQNILSSDSAFFEVFKNGFGANLCFTLFLCISSALIILIPLTIFLIGFKGFSAGYTSAFIIKLYRLRGAVVSLGAIAVPLFFSLPAIFMMFMLSMETNIQNFHNHPGADIRLKSYSSYCFKMLLLFCYLTAISLAEAFISRGIFTFLTK